MDEERFVNAATHGLSCRARADAQAELRSHLHERTQQLMLGGQTELDARTQALQEIGPASTVAWKLLQTHPIHWTTALLVIGATVVLPGIFGELVSRVFP